MRVCVYVCVCAGATNYSLSTRARQATAEGETETHTRGWNIAKWLLTLMFFQLELNCRFWFSGTSLGYEFYVLMLILRSHKAADNGWLR